MNIFTLRKSRAFTFVYTLIITCSFFATPVNSAGDDNARKKPTDEQMFNTSKEKVVVTYRESLIYMALAQSKMAAALDLKKEAELLEAEAEALQSDSSQDLSEGDANKKQKQLFKSYAAVSKRTNKAIDKKLKEKNSLTAEQRKQFAQALSSYAVSLGYVNEFSKAASPFYKSLASDAGVKEVKDRKLNWRNIASTVTETTAKVTNVLTKAGVASYIGRTSPGTMRGHYKLGTSFIAYAKDNKIDVPVSTEKAVASVKMPDWKNI